MGNSSVNALVYLIEAVSGLYLLVLLLRLLLPWLRINFNNPISQGILRLTSPLVLPVRRLLPPIGKIDTATLLVAFGVQYLAVFVIVLIYRVPPSLLPIAITSIVKLAMLTLHLFAYACVIRIILGWFGVTGQYNPAIAVIDSITEPILKPFRDRIPNVGTLDISPIFPILLLFATAILISGLKPLPI